MTPAKEKAKELVDKMWQCIAEYPSRSDAKQCALICCEEIMILFRPLSSEFNYWQQVKNEINNL